MDSSPPSRPVYTSPSLSLPPHHSDLGAHGATLQKVIPVHPHPLPSPGGGGGGHPLSIVDMGSRGLIMSSLVIVVDSASWTLNWGGYDMVGMIDTLVVIAIIIPVIVVAVVGYIPRAFF